MEKDRIVDGGQAWLKGDEGGRGGADERGVVLVHAVDGDAVHGGAGGLGEGGAPGEVGGVEDARPINRADHDGRAGAEEDEADGFERIIDRFDRFDPAAAERVADGRGDIETKRREAQVAGGGGGIGRAEERRGERRGRGGGQGLVEETAAGERGHGDFGRTIGTRGKSAEQVNGKRAVGGSETLAKCDRRTDSWS